MTFGDFRKLFRIPAETDTIYVFKSRDKYGGSDEWIVATDDSSKLPRIDGVIEAETSTL